MTTALLSLLALVTWQFEIKGEDILAACALIILIAVAVWWRWRRSLRCPHTSERIDGE
jgi:hypothetical protein